MRVPPKKSPHVVGSENALFRPLFANVHKIFTSDSPEASSKSSSISSDRKSRFEQPVLKIFSMAKNSHRPNGQRHQVSSLHSAALRVILVLEFICWEVASPSSAFAVPAMLLHRGTTSGFQAFGGYAPRLCRESRTNRRRGRDGAGIAFCCSPFLKDA